MDRQLEMISKDKVRTVDIIKTGTDSCKICLCSNGFCQVEIHTKENLLKLSKYSLRHRPCMKFANYYLENGIEDKNCYWMDQFLSSTKENMRCDLQINIHSERAYINVVNCGGFKFMTINFNIGNKEYITVDNMAFRIKYEDFGRMSVEEIFTMLDCWNVTEQYDYYELTEKEKQGIIRIGLSTEEICLVRVDDIKLYTYEDLVYKLGSGRYLKFVDYYHTHKVLLWNKIPEKVTTKLTKAQLLDRKIVLISIHADGTPEFMFF